MNARKFTFSLNVETLDRETIKERVAEAMIAFERENDDGQLTCPDGDTVTWETNVEQVSF